MNKFLMCIITVALLLTNSVATALVINTFDNGWYNATGFHNPANTNIFTGNAGGIEYRDFQAFDLASASGNTIIGATLTYIAGNGIFLSDEGTETIKISDFTSSIDALLSGTGGVGAFNDLGTGSVFGAATVTQVSGASMPEVSIALNALGIASLNATLAASDQRFVLGGALTTLDTSFNEAMFSGSSGIPSSRLDLVFGSAPEPSILALMGLGLAGIGFTRRKKS